MCYRQIVSGEIFKTKLWDLVEIMEMYLDVVYLRYQTVGGNTAGLLAHIVRRESGCNTVTMATHPRYLSNTT